jgi:hypothetical protein
VALSLLIAQGEPALDAAGQRALATAIGVGIADAAFLIWSNPSQGTGKPEKGRWSRHGRRPGRFTG